MLIRVPLGTTISFMVVPSTPWRGCDSGSLVSRTALEPLSVTTPQLGRNHDLLPRDERHRRVPRKREGVRTYKARFQSRILTDAAFPYRWHRGRATRRADRKKYPGRFEPRLFPPVACLEHLAARKECVRPLPAHWRSSRFRRT